MNICGINQGCIPGLIDNPCDSGTEDSPAQFGQARIVVDVALQILHLCGNGGIIKSYQVSTARNGAGSRIGSGKTPLGLHKIVHKIGDGAPERTIFKARVNTGKKAKLNVENAGDLVTTRIMWLKGMEPGKNSGAGMDSYRRYIYIHGTPEEKLIGTRASHGCIRMKNKEVIDLFDQVEEGSMVDIRENLLFTKPEEKEELGDGS
ncbi:MAG: L,D-transpeptidase [Gammaproteobacteria bacterium]|nr:L,D-transpeptidase [Gammaproteobacteria bacterium]